MTGNPPLKRWAIIGRPSGTSLIKRGWQWRFAGIAGSTPGYCLATLRVGQAGIAPAFCGYGFRWCRPLASQAAGIQRPRFRENEE
jgi:hypothetical protein